MPQCLVSFGANLGSRDSAIITAARKLAAMPEVENFRTSRLFETPAIGGPSGQSAFLNGVCAFDTIARARDVLHCLQSIEQDLGRHRSQRWSARCIDLDVVLHGDLVGEGDDLTVPHPRYMARRFVLRPACDVAPQYRDPRCGWTLARLANHLDEGNASLALAGGGESMRTEICRRLSDERGIQTFAAAPMPPPMIVRGTAPAGLPAEPLPQTTIELSDDRPWVAGFVPPQLDEDRQPPRNVPRLIARIDWTDPSQRWPAPHRLWPARCEWPQYQLEIDDLEWATGEIVSALDSMRCPLQPLDDDQHWWK